VLSNRRERRELLEPGACAGLHGPRWIPSMESKNARPWDFLMREGEEMVREREAGERESMGDFV